MPFTSSFYTNMEYGIGSKRYIAKDFEIQKRENPEDITTLLVACWLNTPSAQDFLERIRGDDDLYTYLKMRNSECISNNNESIWVYIAWGGNLQVLEQAIRNGNSLNTSPGDLGRKFIHYLAWGGNYSVLLKYIETFSISPDEFKDDRGTSIWHYLAESDNYVALKSAIIENKFDPHLLKDNDGYTIAYHLVWSTNYLGLLDAILNGWIDPKYRGDRADSFISSTLKNKDFYQLMENDNMYQSCVDWDDLTRSFEDLDENKFVQAFEKIALPEVGLAFILYQLKNAANDLLSEETLFESVKILLGKLVTRLDFYQAQDYQDVVYDILQHSFIMNVLTQGLSSEEMGKIILKCFSVGNLKSVDLINSLLTHLYSFAKEDFFVTLQKMLILASESPNKGSLPEATCEVLQNFYSFKSAAVDNAKTFDDFMVTLETSQQKLLQKILTISSKSSRATKLMCMRL
jgi:hypothetical protein